jgi:hypothetical protein
MTQAVEDRGWNAAENIAHALIPAFGPQLGRATVTWAEPLQIPDQQAALFDFQLPASGQQIKLHRLGAPAFVEVTHRSSKVSFFYEALAFFIVTMMGLARARRPLAGKVLFVAVIGLAALLSTGIMSAANNRIAQAVLMALALVVLIWFVLGFLSILRHIGARATAPASSPSPGVSPATGPGAPFKPAPVRPAAARTAPANAAVPSFPPNAAFSVWTETDLVPKTPASAEELEFPRLDGGVDSKPAK